MVATCTSFILSYRNLGGCSLNSFLSNRNSCYSFNVPLFRPASSRQQNMYIKIYKKLNNRGNATHM